MFEAIHAEIEKIQPKSPTELYLSAALSTAHLTDDDEKRLAQLSDSADHGHIMKREHGFFLKLLTLEKTEIESEDGFDVKHNYHEGFSENFNHIMQFCTVNRISLIEFDNDAETSELFEVFDR